MSLLTKNVETNTKILKRKEGYVLAEDEKNSSFLVYSEGDYFCFYESNNKDEAENYFNEVNKK